MKLIVITIVAFSFVVLLIYVATEIVPKWLFLRRHKVHKQTFRQFDMTDKDDRPD